MAENFRPTASWTTLHRRAELVRRLRAFFDDLGFLEVTTPVWSRDSVVDRHLDPVPTRLSLNEADDPSAAVDSAAAFSGGSNLGWLQTSPEQHMKRLLAAGARAIYQVTPVFRAGERGPLHNPEFTMAEWYRVGDDLEAGITLLQTLTSALLPDRGPVERITYRQAFERHAGIDPWQVSDDELCRLAASVSGTESLARPDDRDLCLDLMLVNRVEPQLGFQAPTIVYDYPASQSALAQVRTLPDGRRVAERFELYIDGIELANGYHELLDADELAGRTEQANGERLAAGKTPLPGPRQLIAAMQAGLPACSGTALGVDRLIMVATGARTIDEVLTFPYERA
ncbi:MAG: EF-P lysine aminoacylase EpmA [Pirellulales bacterium]